jgi:hypothetical protein
MKYFILTPILLMTLACGSTAKTQSKSKNLSESHLFKVADIDLKVQVDYKSSNYKNYTPVCQCKYIVTNLGKTDLKPQIQYDTIINNVKNTLLKHPTISFEITTNDGKFIQAKQRIDENLLSGYSTAGKTLGQYVGEKRYCTDIKPVKIKYEP